MYIRLIVESHAGDNSILFASALCLSIHSYIDDLEGIQFNLAPILGTIKLSIPNTPGCFYYWSGSVPSYIHLCVWT